MRAGLACGFDGSGRRAQVESAISQEVDERSADLVEAAGDLGNLKRIVRQLHFKLELAQRKMATLAAQSGAEARTVQRLRRRRERAAALCDVRRARALCWLCRCAHSKVDWAVPSP